MHKPLILFILTALMVALADLVLAKSAPESGTFGPQQERQRQSVQLGPRPFFLVHDMDSGELKTRLSQCSPGRFKRTDFSIGHRGAALQFPEHTQESYEAGARMGAGIIECDVTFTKDKELVCRHDQCDLHTTTNILATPLAEKCSVPPDYSSQTPFANVKCCASDITLAEFKTLRGKMDAANPKASTLETYMNATPSWRTDLYAGPSSGTLLSHKESIELFKILGVKMTPELKIPQVAMPFAGFTQEAFAQKMIDEYKAAGVSPRKVFPQSFSVDDVLYWVQHEPAFGEQAVYLDDIDPTDTSPANDLPPTLAELRSLHARGVNIIAPPMWALLALEGSKMVPSQYAKDAKTAGLAIITWTLERSGLLHDGGGWYYQTVHPVINNPGDMLNVLDVLAQDVGIRGIFSDWPATVTYYANCKGL